MKTLIKINYWVEVILLAITLLVLVVSSILAINHGPTVFIFAMYIYMLLGICQLLSTLIINFVGRFKNNGFALHLISSIMTIIGIRLAVELGDYVMLFFLFGLPVTLAIYYWHLSFNLYHKKPWKRLF